MNISKTLIAAALLLALTGSGECAPPQDSEAGSTQTSATTAAGSPVPLTLRQAEAMALKNNPQISVGKLRALIAQQFVREQRSALMPTAFFSLTAVDANPGSRIAAGGLTNPILFPRAAGGATVSQLITDFGRTTNLLKGSEYQAKAEDENSAATTAQILLAVDQAFYGALETQALVQVAQETLKARQVFGDKISALTKAKLRSDLDLSFGRVEEARAKLLVLEARNNYGAALATLSAVLGYANEQNFELQEESTEINPPPLDVNPLIAQALQQRPEVASLEDQILAAGKNANAEHDLWRPTVSALGVVGQAPVRDDHIPSWYGGVGVNVNIPVFNGFLYNARAKAADLQAEVNRQRLSDLRNLLARDVRIAWQDSNRGYERLSVTKQLEEQASLALDLSQARYNLGLGSIVELTQAELQKTEADISDTDARYQYRLTQLVLAYTIAAPR
jgi:outer membrane protein